MEGRDSDGSRFRPHIPKPVLLALTALLALWATVYARGYGPWNFLWFCDLAAFLIVLALWLESPLLLGSQAVSVLVAQAVWTLDLLGRALFGVHPIGGTAYVFEPATPMSLRMGSVFHLVTPAVVLWALRRLGFHRRAWILQTAIAWVVLPVCFALASPEKNLNFVFGPRGPQMRVDPRLYFGALMLAYPLLLYLPTHLVLRQLFSAPASRPDSPRPPAESRR